MRRARCRISATSVMYITQGKGIMLKRVGVLLWALSWSGLCLAAKPIELPMPLGESLPVEIVEAQQELGVVVPATAQNMGMQFGLIGALIGSAVQNSQVKNAEEAVVPLRDLLVGYPFNQKMQDALRAKLVSEGISPNPQVTVMPSTWEAYDAQQKAQLPPQALVLTPSYSVDSQFTQLTVLVHAQFVERSVKSNGKIKVVPRLTRDYSYQFPMSGARSPEPIQDWVALGAPGLAAVVDRGIQQSVDMLVNDFTAESRAAWNAKVKAEAVNLSGMRYSGVPVRQGEGWSWLRMGRGHMQTLLGLEPLLAGAPLPAAFVPPAAPTMVAAAEGVTGETPAEAIATGAVDAAAPAPAAEPATQAAPDVAPATTPADAAAATAPVGG